MSTIQDLVSKHKYTLGLSWISGEAFANQPLADQVVSSSDFIGRLNIVHPKRIQVIGREEINHIQTISTAALQRALDTFKQHKSPCFIIANSLEAPSSILSFCAEHQLPLLSSTAEASYLIDTLRSYLSRICAPKLPTHGVFMDVLGLGVLITGESGIGKSELALELISRGHGLVADDIVILTRHAPNAIEGRCEPILQNLLEVRGIGLLDIKAIFGETAVRRKMNLKLIIHLVRDHDEDFERLPFNEQGEDILGLTIPRINLAVKAGRNLAVLVEAAVRNTILTLRGVNTLSTFIDRQSLAITERTNNEPS